MVQMIIINGWLQSFEDFVWSLRVAKIKPELFNVDLKVLGDLDAIADHSAQV